MSVSDPIVTSNIREAIGDTPEMDAALPLPSVKCTVAQRPLPLPQTSGARGQRMDQSIADATWVRDNAHYAGTVSLAGIIASRMRRWRPFLSGVAIALACCFFVGYALANPLV
jgi:hypothetical protein